MKNKNQFWTIPNILTYIRILSIPFLIYYLYIGYVWTAFFIYAVGTITDWFDGYIARKYNQGTDFGRALDPIADKLIVIAVLMILSYSKFGIYEVVLAYIIIFREILISGFREALADYNLKMPVLYIAKVKTTMQMVCLPFLFVFERGTLLYNIGILLFVIAVFLTVYTGAIYSGKIIKTLEKGK